MADMLKLISWNVRGLNSPHKQSLVFSYLKKYKPHIICLQETHLTGTMVWYLKRPWLATQYHATYSNYSQGVSILLARSLPAEILLVKTDPAGRFIILTLRIVSTIFTLVNIYVPPPFSPDVLSHLSLLLLSRSPSPLLFVGDFNAVLDPAMDRLRGGGRP